MRFALFLIIFTFSCQVYSNKVNAHESSPERANHGVRDETFDLIKSLADELFRSSVKIGPDTVHTALTGFCVAMSLSTTETKLKMSLDTFFRNIDDNSELVELTNSVKERILADENFQSVDKSTINDNLFYNYLIYELKCHNNGEPQFIYHFLLLNNPIILQKVIDRGDRKMQQIQFSKERKYNDKYEDFLSLAKSYLPVMRQGVFKNIYVKIVRSIKQRSENIE